MDLSLTRVRAAVNLKQSLGVDAGIDLRRRERGMAEQFLDRAQIAATGQKVGGKGMPERVRRGAVGQAERAAQPRHCELNDAGAQGSAAGADKDRPLRLED